MVLRLLVLLALLGLALGRPIVIGHRGAPGYRPEHTFDSYGLAIDLGADFIELDLQPTKDNELIVLHDHDLSVATDVALHPEFADRFSWRVKYGKNESGWWPEDFLLSEIRTLRVRQVIAFRNQDFNWLYSIPTFNETIQFLMAKQSISKRTVGLLVELKDPAYFAALGLAIEPNVLNSLRAYNYSLSKPDPTRIIIQSFEVASMQWVHSQCNVTLVQLINVPTDFIGPTNETFAQLLQQLPLIKTYAWGIGPWKSEIVPQVNSSGGSGGTSLLADTTLIKEAHALGLKVFAWTFRSDAFYLNAQYHGSWEEEYFRFARAGLDGFITDFTDNAITALDAYAEQEQDSTAIAQEFAVTVGLLVAALLGLAICAVVLFKRPVSPPGADTEHLTREPSLPKYT